MGLGRHSSCVCVHCFKLSCESPFVCPQCFGSQSKAATIWRCTYCARLSKVCYQLFSQSAQSHFTLPRYNNPLHMFAESFLDRTRAAARYFRSVITFGAFNEFLFSSSASIATNGELTFSSTFGGGSAQLTRIDESSLTGQLNLRSQS